MRLLPLLLLAACAPSKAPAPQPAEARVRNVILVIGDGMGPQQVGLLDLLARRGGFERHAAGRPAMFRLAAQGYTGLSATDTHDALVTDSACSATQLALGLPARSETIGVDADGEPRATILERAEAAGRWTGLVSDTRLTHATPAAFAAHQPHRSLEDAIAEQMLASGAEVLLSGGLRHFLPPGDDAAARWGVPYPTRGGRKDGADLLATAKESGYTLAFDRATLTAATSGDRVLGLFTPSQMADGITSTATVGDPARTEPTLREMTEAALTVLERSPDGFFLMVEGGQVDWAGHANDAGWLVHELWKIDDAIDAILTWAADRDDTLVVVTADHETGGFGLSYSMHDVPAPTPLPGAAFAGRPFAPNYNFGDPAGLADLAAQARTLEAILEEGGGDPAALTRAVAAHTRYTLTDAEAAAVLASRANPYHVEGGKTSPQMPDIHDFTAFYPAGEMARTAALARALADDQGVVWATGTHTHAPVPVFAFGPPAVAGRFAGFGHHVELGARLQHALLGP